MFMTGTAGVWLRTGACEGQTLHSKDRNVEKSPLLLWTAGSEEASVSVHVCEAYLTVFWDRGSHWKHCVLM